MTSGTCLRRAKYWLGAKAAWRFEPYTEIPKCNLASYGMPGASAFRPDAEGVEKPCMEFKPEVRVAILSQLGSLTTATIVDAHCSSFTGARSSLTSSAWKRRTGAGAQGTT